MWRALGQLGLLRVGTGGEGVGPECRSRCVGGPVRDGACLARSGSGHNGSGSAFVLTVDGLASPATAHESRGGRLVKFWVESLDLLVRTRGTALIRYGFLLCGDRSGAEDLVQDALMRTFTSGRTAMDVRQAELYVRRTMANIYIDGFRRQRRWAAVRRLVAEPDTAPPVDPVDRLDIESALRLLSPRQRACVVLRFYEDLTIPGIADVLSLSSGSVKRYLSDGVRNMEALLGPLPRDTEAVATESTEDAPVIAKVTR